MKLTVVSAWFPDPPDNGSKLRAFHLIRQLAARHEIVLLSFAEPGEAEPAALARLRTMCRTVEVVRGNPHKAGTLRWRDFWREVPRSYLATYSPAMVDAIDRHASRADVLIALGIGSAVHARHVRSLPRVFEEAECTVIVESARRARGLDRLRRGLSWQKYARFLRVLVDEYDRTTVVSPLEREALRRAGCNPDKLVVVPNGVDLAPPGPVRKRPATLVYPGALTYSANQDAVTFFVAEVLPRIRAARPDARLFVTGRTDGVETSGLAGRDGVVLTGYLDDVRTFIAECDVCVVPLRVGGGTRMKILEAMALGTPVVSTSKGAEGLDVVPGQHLLIGDTPEALAAHVLDLLAQPERAAAIADRARQLVASRYSWPEIAAHLEDVVQTLVSSRAPAESTGR